MIKTQYLKHIKVSNKDITIINATYQVYKINIKNDCGYFKKCDDDEKEKEFLADINRKLAYEALAIEFGLEEYIPHSELCVLETETEKCIGCFQDPSKGIDIWCLPSENRIKMITPSFHMALTKMRLFDVICHEADHSLNNYYPVSDQAGYFVSVSMFDNGGAGTFGKSPSISYSTFCGCAPLFSEDGHFTFPYQDEGLIGAINSINAFRLLRILSPYLGFLSVYCTWLRIKKIRRIVKKDRASGLLKELASNQWSNRTIQEELSGKYGKTYLYSMVHDWGGDGKKPGER